MTNITYTMTDDAIAEELGGRIKQLRLEQNITLMEMAESLGVTRTTYTKVESGRVTLPLLIGEIRKYRVLESFESLLPESDFSPLAQLELKVKTRQRSSRRGKQVKKRQDARAIIVIE